MRIAFLGTPPFAVAALDALARAGHSILCVVAQPDRPAGRGQALKAPATKGWAKGREIPVLQPEKVRNGQLAAELGKLVPDLLVVVAYGRILGKDLLTLAPHGALNVHASLLPKHRGAAPIQWSIAQGERETGVSIMQMDEGLDTGDILLQRVVSIARDEIAPELHDRLANAGGEALCETLELMAAERLTPVAQDATAATLAPILEKDHGRLDFSKPAASLYDRWRGFAPWPGAFTTLAGRSLKIGRLTPRPPPNPGVAGTVFLLDGRIGVHCGGGTALDFALLQLEGKKMLPAAAFLQGHPIAAGTKLGD